MGYIRRGDIHGKGAHIEWRHIRREDIEYTPRGDTHRVGTYTEKGHT